MNGPEILVPILFIAGAIIVFYKFISTRHSERMAMLEKGLSAEALKEPVTMEIRRDPFTSLKWGLLLIFVGLATVLGNYLHDLYNVSDGFIIGLICLFAGCALLIYYGIANKKEVKP